MEINNIQYKEYSKAIDAYERRFNKKLGITIDGYSICVGDKLWCYKEGKVKEVYDLNYVENNVIYFKSKYAYMVFTFYSTQLYKIDMENKILTEIINNVKYNVQ